MPGLSRRPGRDDPAGSGRRPARVLPAGSPPVSLSSITGRVWGRARRYPLEAVAVVVLVLGVLIFPPFWLIGVFVALLSRLWDMKDKLIGLAGPALLAIVGTGVGLATGDNRSMSGFLHEAASLSTDLLRVGAILGAIYLGWRVSKGRRQEPTPPWMRNQGQRR